MTDEEKQAKIDALNKLGQNSWNDINGESKVYPDTGRKANSPGDVIESYTSAPAKAAIAQMQQGNFGQALPTAWNQMGNDPRTAPTGQQLVETAGVPAGLPSKIAGGALNMATDPMSYLGTPGGVAGSIEKVGAQEAPTALEKMWQTGQISYPAKNAAQAEQVRQALMKTGKVGPGRNLVKVIP